MNLKISYICLLLIVLKMFISILSLHCKPSILQSCIPVVLCSLALKVESLVALILFIYLIFWIFHQLPNINREECAITVVTGMQCLNKLGGLFGRVLCTPATSTPVETFRVVATGHSCPIACWKHWCSRSTTVICFSVASDKTFFDIYVMWQVIMAFDGVHCCWEFE